MPTSLQGRAQQAARHKGSRCRNRYGMRDEDVRTQGWRAIRKEAAAGVDQVRAQASAQPRDATIHDLGERLQQTRSRATRVRRPDRPNGEGTRRPLGIPAGAETRRPRAVARLLAAIDAQDFLRCRSGSRPQVGALEAVDTRTITRQGGRYAWVVAADITQCLDTIEQEWMVRMVAERMDDGARRRLRQPWLQAGVRDTDGQGRHPGTGPPPGGTVSPVLAKVFLHDGLDVWLATVVKRHGRGAACLMRAADDGVCACEDQAEAERFDHVLGQRREKFGLALSGAKGLKNN